MSYNSLDNEWGTDIIDLGGDNIYSIRFNGETYRCRARTNEHPFELPTLLYLFDKSTFGTGWFERQYLSGKHVIYEYHRFKNGNLVYYEDIPNCIKFYQSGACYECQWLDSFCKIGLREYFYFRKKLLEKKYIGDWII